MEVIFVLILGGIFIFFYLKYFIPELFNFLNKQLYKLGDFGGGKINGYIEPKIVKKQIVENDQEYKEKDFNFKDFIKNYFSIKGRYNRKTFFILSLIYSLVFGLINLFLLFSFKYNYFLIGIIISSFFSFFPLVKRFHDINFSGFWILLLFLPQISLGITFMLDGTSILETSRILNIIFSSISGVGIIIGTFSQFILTILLFLKQGTSGPNRFGE